MVKLLKVEIIDIHCDKQVDEHYVWQVGKMMNHLDDDYAIIQEIEVYHDDGYVVVKATFEKGFVLNKFPEFSIIQLSEDYA